MKYHTKLLHSLWLLILVGIGAQTATVEELEARLLKLEQEALLLKQEIETMKQNTAVNPVRANSENAPLISGQQQSTARPPALNVSIMQRPDNLQPQNQAAMAEQGATPAVAPANNTPIAQPSDNAQAEVAQQAFEATNTDATANNNDSTDVSTAAKPMPMELLQAISQVQSGSFFDAENALVQYVSNEQNSHLDRAYYWLGEATYRQNKFEDSSKHFTQAYLKNKKGTSAPDSLIRLGMSLARIDKKQEACKVLGVVERDFPDENIKVKIAQGEKTRIQCP